jgi:hypothetical protein
MSQPIHQQLQSVSSANDLAAFILALRQDLLTRPDEWQNGDMSSAFEAMAAWLCDTERFKSNHGESLADHNPFQLCAETLYASKVYE